MLFKVTKRINPLDRSEAKYYAAPFYSEELGIRDLAKEISDSCTLNVTDVKAVLTSFVTKLPNYLKSGFKIQLGSFGRVKLSFSSKGFETPDEVDASSITNKRIIFTPGTEIKGEIEDTSFRKIELA